MKSFNVLLLCSFAMMTIEGWLGSWYVASFTRLLDKDTIAWTDILSSSVGLLSMMWTVKKIPTPRIKHVIGVNLITYSSLSLIPLFGVDMYIITSSVLGGLFAGITQCFGTALLAQNLSDSKIRKKFDDTSAIATRVAMILGGFGFLAYKAGEIDPLWVWLTVYALIDLVLIVKLLAMYRGWLKYER